MEQPEKQLMQAFLADDHASVDELLKAYPAFCQRLNEGVFGEGMPPLAAAKSREMVDVLLAHGATVDAVTQWWKPGFGANRVAPETARYLVQRRAVLTIHAATAIGLSDLVREMLKRDAALSRAPGGDGAHPLHFCSDAKIARTLIEHGADMEARDEDHDSTPVQWRVGDAPNFVRFLLKEGARADIFLAAGLGDLPLVKRLVADVPACTTYRIGNNKGPFPGIGFRGRGGSIYQWTLGFNLSPHEVALKRGHRNVYDFLMANTPHEAKFLVACTSANRTVAEQILADHPQILSQLDEEDKALLPKFCWETNKDIEAVRLMLDLGFPIEAREFNHGYTALHNAAWCGDPELVSLLIERGHPTDVRDPDHASTPIGWAVHSCLDAKRHPTGRFPQVVARLLEAGVPFDPKYYPVGHAGIDKIIKQHLRI